MAVFGKFIVPEFAPTRESQVVEMRLAHCSYVQSKE